MKIKVAGLFVLFFMVSGYCQPQFGLDFSIGSSNLVGLNIRFSHFYELKPSCAIAISKPDNRFSVILNNNFYLKDIKKLQNYIGISLGYVNYGFNDLISDDTWIISGQYGLRYNINEILGLYGELGILAGTPIISTISKLGITVYFTSNN